jgi:hypothetical protein
MSKMSVLLALGAVLIGCMPIVYKTFVKNPIPDPVQSVQTPPTGEKSPELSPPPSKNPTTVKECTTKTPDPSPVALIPYDSKGEPGRFDKASGTTFKVPTSVTWTGKSFPLGNETLYEISAPYKGWITANSLECK